MTTAPGCVRVLQFTDTHLYAAPETTLLGMNTESSFELCLALARQRFWPADLVLASGDLVHDASADGYGRLHARLASLHTPVHAIPGNHDAADVLRSHLIAGSVHDGGAVLCGQWQIVLLDSSLPDSDAGRLSAAQLRHLETSLQAHPQRHALICLHHPPVDVGSRWLDTMKLQNADAFFALVDRHPQVRAVLWGHVHQAFEDLRHDVRLLASPSTCVQFKPDSADFAIDARTPGFRWLTLGDDGDLETGIERLDQMPPGLQLHSHGY